MKKKQITSYDRKLDSLLSESVKKSSLKEGFGQNGYFPPMGADRYAEKGDSEPEIYKGNTAIKVATELKKLIDKIQPEFLELGQRVVPFVNYRVSHRSGMLVLGYAFVNSKTPATKDDNQYGQSAEKKYDSKLKNILEKGKTPLWRGFHNGFSGKYKGEPYKSGIVNSIVTPQQQFSAEMQQKITQIFEK
jgi:hypothetical protein